MPFVFKGVVIIDRLAQISIRTFTTTAIIMARMNIRASGRRNQTVRRLFNHGAHTGAPLQMDIGGMKGL
ncbi:MAG: hypothetical protein PHN55_07630 [Dysgonamonadaceae bacterium]|nr:hypothetical protein [Dysgonamonadaceae bacterium]